MPSRIVPTNIDGTFPVAGQDNSSQGFRDNFTNIKNNFTFARNELDDLQNKVLLTSALSGQTLNNDMAGAQLIRPQLRAWTQSLVDKGSVGGTVNISFDQGNFQKITTTDNITLDLSNWPASIGAGALGYGLARVWIVVNRNTLESPIHTLTLPASVTIGVDDIAGYDPATRTITFDDVGNYIFDFSSIDSGASYLIFDLKRNRSTLRDPALYFNDQVNSTLLVGWREGLNTALVLNQGQNSVSSRGSYNSAIVSNLANASITSGTVDGQMMSGYTLTSIRGNLEANVFTPTASSDYLGYHNAVTYTGFANVANTFQQTASMAFYATGSNVTYGLGGNIAFYTKRDGGNGTLQGINQAMGVENDQSVKFFGNVITGNTFVPASSATAGGVPGQISFDASNVYICIGPGNWKKAALTTF
jgi:hypothetical protein